MLGQLPVSRGWILAHPSGNAAPLWKPHVFRARASPDKGHLQCPILLLPPAETTHLGLGDSLVSDNKGFVQLGEVRASEPGCKLPV